MDETKNAERSPKEAAAQLSSSITKISTLPKNIHKAADTADTQETPAKPSRGELLTQENKILKQHTPDKVAGQLRSSITNVATLPKSSSKITESLKSTQTEKGK